MRPIKLILYATLLIFANGCQKKNEVLPFPKGGYNFEKIIDSRDSSFPFYPLRHVETRNGFNT